MVWRQLGNYERKISRPLLFLQASKSEQKVENKESKADGYKNVREYSKYLMDKYSCLTPGNNVAVTVTSGMLKKAMTDEKTGKWLERELGKAPDYIKQAQQAASARGSKLLSCTIEFGEEYTTMCVCAVTDTPGTDEDIDKWVERVKEKKEEQKKLEQRLIFKGNDVKSVTESFIEEMSNVNSILSSVTGFDVKA